VAVEGTAFLVAYLHLSLAPGQIPGQKPGKTLSRMGDLGEATLAC
jgi:hypothetical protein